MILFAKIIVTLGFLFAGFSFLFNQFNSRSSSKKVAFNLLVLICSIPLIYAVYTDKVENTAFIKLDIGLAYNLTWVITILVLLLAFLILLVNKRN